ncbi:hypothetical protein QBC38DRAFT_378432 [Podospora fimiseda]|uniref:AA1-like domain-containing protein n=1 Tax=Podospora fimiseda TaxID=252190 RepID=A0AAN7BCI7_9PEZI|nr:hypothetical protein QBC38DRAFT_378432 [Podospora fimiseda]
MHFTTFLLSSLVGICAAASSSTCTPDSYKNITSFILREYEIETIGSDSRLRGTLSVENPGTGDIYKLDRIGISVGGGVWSVCVAGRDAPLPSELVRCQYLIERRSKRIGFRFQWYCDSLLFDATVIGDLPTEICVAKTPATADGVTQTCSLPAEQKEVLLSVENIYWEEVGQTE